MLPPGRAVADRRAAGGIHRRFARQMLVSPEPRLSLQIQSEALNVKYAGLSGNFSAIRRINHIALEASAV